MSERERVAWRLGIFLLWLSIVTTCGYVGFILQISSRDIILLCTFSSMFAGFIFLMISP